jgi:iron complex outermembrane receptor protein
MSSRHLARILAAAAIGAVLVHPLSGQSTGTLSGRVLSAGGSPAADARVTLLELKRRAAVADDGAFRFENIPPGTYLLEAQSPRSGYAIERVSVTPGEQAPLEIRLDLAVHTERVTVTGSELRSVAETAQPVTVLDDRELLEKKQVTLGETLAQEPGVTSTQFSPGSSRPIIRGLGGDRIRVLEAGIGTGDASTTSPDHAVATDPISAETIEILRGPATLLYGSSAIGGVVNVLDERIPTYLPDRPITGSLELRGGTVAEELGGAASLTGHFGSIAWHVDGLNRETKDYDIPGRARTQPDEEGGEGAYGFVPNSATAAEGGTAGLSWIGEGGFLGVSATRFDTVYGIPAEEEVTIDLQQRRVDVKGGVTQPFAFLRGLNLRFGTTDYEHVELEGAEVGTRFLNESWEARLEAPHKRIGIMTGSFGVQAFNRKFEAIGEEAFLPPTDTDAWAVFAFEELDFGPVRLQLGARYENQDVSASFADFPFESPITGRSLDGLSGSVGLVWLPATDYSVGLSVARSVKLPNAEELFAHGPHIATNAFEIGDPNFDEEKSLGADLSFRKVHGGLTFQISAFASRFDDFIFDEFTGEEEDGLQVIRFVQRDAEFVGGEAHVDIGLVHTEPHHLELELFGDYVRAELRDTGDPLPRIPPLRYGTGLVYQGPSFSGRVEVRHVDEQDRVSEFEEPTESYTMLNASLGYRFFLGGVINDVLLRGTNLTDEEARNHVSFLKGLAPLPGRDVSLVYRLSF